MKLNRFVSYHKSVQHKDTCNIAADILEVFGKYLTTVMTLSVREIRDK